jgi:hypothetical protein
METHPAANPTNPIDTIPRATYYQITHELLRSLPPPITDSPEDKARRDIAAIARVAALLPATLEEADIATQYVAACAQSLDALRLAREFPASPELFLKCTAQSAGMMRQARSWRALLARTQAARAQRDTASDTATRDLAAQTERHALGLLAGALAEAPPAPMPPANTDLTPLAEAERYALQHRKRATLIRSLGRLPDKLDLGSLAPEVVHAIATGSTAILQALGPRRRLPTAEAA